MKRRLLIDGDILIYKIATQNEVDTHWGDGMWTLHCDENICKAHVDNTIENLMSDLEADAFMIALTDKNNFRKDVLPSYKHNRKSKRKPMVLNSLKEYVINKYKAKIFKNLEADDVLGIFATSPHNEERIIVSVDKDLNQIPTLVSDGKTIRKVSKEHANYFFMVQALSGDAGDGYTGLPQCGIKTAHKLLGDNINVPLLDLWKKVLSAYTNKGYSEKEALQQARVAKILTYKEYNRKTGEVLLWQGV
jgi:DNA polymerase-1